MLSTSYLFSHLKATNIRPSFSEQDQVVHLTKCTCYIKNIVSKVFIDLCLCQIHNDVHTEQTHGGTKPLVTTNSRNNVWSAKNIGRQICIDIPPF